jgi:ectoine hydroxylase-related dioxygenase (phytanoyl-CoA dioxygenase family)
MISDQQKQDFSEQGYVVIPDVVPPKLCQKAIDAIISYLGVDLADETTWYQETFAGHGIVPLHHHQAFWNIRQCEKVHSVFSDLYNDEKLWVSMDRASYKPPGSPQTRGWAEAPVHWDCDPFIDNDFSIQGLVYLSDTRDDQGAFSCVPAIYQNLSAYIDHHLDDHDRRHPSFAAADLKFVEGDAGSLVVFNRLLPHSSGLNTSRDHRFVQYLTMQPQGSEKQRSQRVQEWFEKLPPQWAIDQKIERQDIPEPGAAATLSSLGEKLVGVDSW